MSEELKKKLLKYKGTISQEDVDDMTKLLNFNRYRKSITGIAAGEKEMEYLRKNMPNLKRYK